MTLRQFTRLGNSHKPTLLQTISFIIPVLNESDLIVSQLQRLQQYRSQGHEVIVVDGGSEDGSRQLAEPLADRVLHSQAGRARQMNTAADQATGTVLLFLHIDTTLPDKVAELVNGALGDSQKRWGWFDVRFGGASAGISRSASDNSSKSLALISTSMNRRARMTSVCTGDQGLFVEASLFLAIGGFPPIALMEDVAISKLLRQRGQPATLRQQAIISSRRWQENGVLRTVLLMWKLRLLYFFGTDPKKLVELYYPGRVAPGKVTKEQHGGNYQYPNARILLFAKEPVSGEVKTRMGKSLGADRALLLYEALLQRIADLLKTIKLAPWQLWVSSNPSHESFISLCNKKNIYRQSQGDLGEKMSQAVEQTWANSYTTSVVLVGTDCPAMDGDYLEKALKSLDAGHEVVIGPAEDGGYVLIGMNRPIAELFADIDWGSDRVMEQTRQRLEDLGIEALELPTLWDVDRPEDVRRLGTLKPPLEWS